MPVLQNNPGSAVPLFPDLPYNARRSRLLFPVPFPVLNIHCSLKAPQKNPGGLQYISFPLPRSLPAPVPSCGTDAIPIQNNAHKYSSCQNHHTARKHLSAFPLFLSSSSRFVFPLFRFTSADCFSCSIFSPFPRSEIFCIIFLFYLFLMAKNVHFYFLSNIIQFHSVKISKNTHLLFFCFCEFFIRSFHFCIYCTIFHIIFVVFPDALCYIIENK